MNTVEYYQKAVTFVQKNKSKAKKIIEDLKRVGDVFHVGFRNGRFFVHYKEEKDALRAISVYEDLYDVKLTSPKGRKFSEKENQLKGNHSLNSVNSNSQIPIVAPKEYDKTIMDTKNRQRKILILGNLPKNYTFKDIKSLVEEVNPLFINELGETKILKLKFCKVGLDSAESLAYLVKKLNDFVICGEKLIAVEEEKLLHWKELI